jgi:Ca-activated chloride channel family protein
MLVLGIIAVPALIVGYVALVRQRDRRAAALAAQGFTPNAKSRRMRKLRHIPFGLFLAALVLLLIAFARPQASVGIPHREGTVILAFDVSNSMKATDIKPTRLDAAKAAAHAFVAKQPADIKIGVVAFSNGAFITQQPTDVKTDVDKAIEGLSPSGATSLGWGIYTSLNAIAGKPITIDPNALNGDLSNLNIGYYGSGAIVLLSDGENTANPDPEQLAQLAAVAGVRVFTVGLGSPQGTVVTIDGFSVATALNEDLLTTIAKDTGGTYYNAQDAASLSKIYSHIDLRLTTQAKKTEITAIFTGASIVLLLIGAVLSLLWFGRLV